MRRAGIAFLIMSVAILAALPKTLLAGTLPDISGTWYAYGDMTKRCHISQSGRSVTVTNEQGQTAQGNFVNNDPNRLNTHWGGFAGGQIFGTISSDLRRIDWSNGTYWTRPAGSYSSSSYSSGSSATGYQVGSSYTAPTPKPTPAPERLNVSPRVAGNAWSPVYVYGASLTNGSNRTWVQCVSFRNVSNKVATDVDFSVVVTRYSGHVEADFGFVERGKFTPPVRIDDHCWHNALWPDHVVRLMALETVHVKEVTFADGTTWKAGMPFVRAYGNSGTALNSPTIVEAPTPTPSPTDSPIPSLSPSPGPVPR